MAWYKGRTVPRTYQQVLLMCRAWREPRSVELGRSTKWRESQLPEPVDQCRKGLPFPQSETYFFKCKVFPHRLSNCLFRIDSAGLVLVSALKSKIMIITIRCRHNLFSWVSVFNDLKSNIPSCQQIRIMNKMSKWTRVNIQWTRVNIQ